MNKLGLLGLYDSSRAVLHDAREGELIPGERSGNQALFGRETVTVRDSITTTPGLRNT